MIFSGIPFSDHSNYYELKTFCQHLKPKVVKAVAGPEGVTLESVSEKCMQWINHC
jgi:hypothetical protein